MKTDDGARSTPAGQRMDPPGGGRRVGGHGRHRLTGVLRRRGTRRTATAVALSLGAAGAIMAGTTSPAAAGDVTTENYTGPGTHLIYIPNGVAQIELDGLGAAGNDGAWSQLSNWGLAKGGAAGSGARVDTTIPVDGDVKPGDLLQVVVGGRGRGGPGGSGGDWATMTAGAGGNGGAATSVTDLTTGELLLVAGGGGGGGGGGDGGLLQVFYPGGSGGSDSSGGNGAGLGGPAGAGGAAGGLSSCAPPAVRAGASGETAPSGSGGGGGGGGGGGYCGGRGGGSGDHAGGGNGAGGGGGGGGGAGGSYAVGINAGWSLSDNASRDGDGSASVSFIYPDPAPIFPQIISTDCVPVFSDSISFELLARAFPRATFGINDAPSWMTVWPDRPVESLGGTARLLWPPNEPPGDYRFQVYAQNSQGVAVQTIDVSIGGTPEAAWVNPDPYNEVLASGSPFSYRYRTIGCDQVLDYQLLSADPTWTPSIDAQTGLVSGTPPAGAAGRHTYTVRATTRQGKQITTQLHLTVDPRPLAMTTGALPDATVGGGYTAQLAATGGAGTPSWALAPGSSLPAGLTMNAQGAITGTPTTPGTSTFTVRLTDSGTRDPQTVTGQLSITVYPALVPVYQELPQGVVGSPYSFPLLATGGTGHYAWSVETGSALPPGMTLGSDGTLAGTPSTAGVTYSTLRLTDTGTTPPASQTMDVLFIIGATGRSFTAHVHPGDDGAVAMAIAGASSDPGAAVIRTPAAGAPDEQWSFTPVGSLYHIVNTATGQCLTTDGTAGDPVHQSPCAEASGQLWQLSGAFGGESCSWARNPASGLYLHQSAADPAVVDTAPWDGGTEAESFFPSSP